MAHFKRRHRRRGGIKGHCSMCSLLRRRGGLRNQRVPSLQEQRADDREEQLRALGADDCCGDSFVCDWCLGLYPFGEEKDPEDAVSIASPTLTATIADRLAA